MSIEDINNIEVGRSGEQENIMSESETAKNHEPFSNREFTQELENALRESEMMKNLDGDGKKSRLNRKISEIITKDKYQDRYSPPFPQEPIFQSLSMLVEEVDAIISYQKYKETLEGIIRVLKALPEEDTENVDERESTSHLHYQ